MAYKYPWKHDDTERPGAVCFDCGLPYGESPDMVIPDELWEEINPTYHKGGGLLCPTCMANRLDYVNRWYEGNLFILTVKGEFGDFKKQELPTDPIMDLDRKMQKQGWDLMLVRVKNAITASYTKVHKRNTPVYKGEGFTIMQAMTNAALEVKKEAGGNG